MKRILMLGCWLAALSWACGRQPAGESTAASAAAEPSILVYSGRNESLIGPLLDRFEESRGIELKVRYGANAEMAATLLEEGAATPADVFISQDAASLGALSGAGLLQTLPQSILDRVPARFRAAAGDWVGVSGRARTVVYNTERVKLEELPRSLEEVTLPRYRRAFGVAPTNGSFQAHMAVYQVLHGGPATLRLLEAMAENEPGRYPKNSAIVEAVIAGEIDWGLVNHYYLWRALQEEPEASAANFFMPESGYVNVAGAAILGSRKAAVELVEFLLSEEAQEHFAETTFEYPLVVGTPAAAGLIPLEHLVSPAVNLAEVARVLPDTLSLISESGLVR
jgi:iron(III) transport system substrate-binding protein